MKYLITSLLCVLTLSLTAQLPNGSVAPDFTATDIDGNEWNLYDLLDEGNTVILNFGATWTEPVWNYTQTGILQDLYSTFGPEGTGDLYVFFLESDDTTTAADLNGTGSATQGDWVSLINYPIIDNASNIFDSYSNTYYPTIYTVCPDGTMNTDTGEMEYTLVESGQATFDAHFQAAFVNCGNAGCTNPNACNYDDTATIEDGSCGTDTDGDGICDIYEIGGCATPFACNYDPEATDDDGSCIFICEGCIDPLACNYEAWANIDVGSCEYLSCAGCTDSIACNYNSESTIDDNSCFYPEEPFLNCFGNCLNDSDYDGVCDEFEIPGCTDENACNFSTLATDSDGSCEYVTCAGCQYEFACNYDPSATIANNESCEYGTCPGCTDPTACNYNPTVSEDDGSCLMLDACGVCGGSGVYEGNIFGEDFGEGVIIPDDQSQCFNSQLSVTGFNEGTIISDANTDMVSLFMNLEHSYMGDLIITLICPNGQSLVVHEQGGGGSYLGVPVDIESQPNDPGIGLDYWWEPGATNGTWADNGGSNSLPSGVYESFQPFTNFNGCPLNGTWEVEVCDLWASDNGFIFNWSLETSFYVEESCDCEGNILDECGVCGGDGSSCIEECEGVLDECGVCDGDGIAEGTCDCDGNIEDECGVCGGGGIADGECDCAGNVLDECGICGGSGIPAEDCDCNGNQLDVLGECGGDCANDFNGDGICDVDEILGCTYPDALNFNEEATADDGSCTYEEFDLDAVYDSGYSDGFVDGENSVICPETSSCPSDLDGNGEVGMSDLLIFLSSFGAFCEAEPVFSPLTDANIHEAVNLWLSDEPSAEAIYGHISDWDVSNVTDMLALFVSSNFNEDISSWDVSNVTIMAWMFAQNSNFNGDLSSWDVSNVSDIRWCFANSHSFNGDLSTWDISNVNSMEGLFSGADSFNGDLSAWDVSSVTSMSNMFFGASSFNGDISSWDVSSVTSMYSLFQFADNFNSDLSSWDVSSVTDMFQLFLNASSFNGDLSSWDVSSVTDMTWIFAGAEALSEENKCAIHTSFSANENWPYDWSEFCPEVCGGLVSHEGYDYSTVQIGEQCWFSENCRYLPEVSPSSEGSDTDPYFYVYGYEGTDASAAMSTAYYETYGALYNWPAVMANGGSLLCPSGWHMPSDGEFTELTDFLGGEGVAGGKMKEAGYEHWNSSNTGATNSSGWTGLPGGYRFSGGFDTNGYYGYWWSASESGSYSWFRSLSNLSDNVYRTNHNRYYGSSARCVRD